MADQEAKEYSQHDLGGVLRSAHDDKNHSLRVTNANTSVPSVYSRVELTYNASDSVTKAKFFEGSLAEIRHITFTEDTAGSLNNTYFTLYSENNEALYHVWYNVSGGGTDPAPANSCGIEIPIETNDPATIIKLATQRCLEKYEDFRTQELAPTKLKIENSRLGLSDNTVDAGTGFTITTIQEGTEKQIKCIEVPFDGKVKYAFNTQEKRFEVFPISDLEVEITGEVDIKNPNTIEISNTTIITKNTEISIVLPDDLKRFTVKARRGIGQMRIAFVSGGTSGTNYETIPRGFVWDSQDVDLANGTTIYLQSDRDGSIVELKAWRRI